MTVAQFVSKAKTLSFEERVELAHRLWDEFMDGFNGWKAPALPDGIFPWKTLKLEIDAELNRSDRIELAQQVWQNITENGYDPDLTPEQIAELNRRLADFEKNPHDGIPWEQVQAEMKQRFGWK
jgi:putative addiction module component (TIGR02574 family)